LPHTPAFIAGGFTAVANAGQVTAFRDKLNQIRDFILSTYIPDVERLAGLYPEYFSIGRGHGHLLSYGVYELDNAGQNKMFQSGHIVNADGPMQSISPAAIQEHIDYSWYTDSVNSRHPAQGETEGQYPKAGAYTWLKAPRYQDKPYECGPLARMKINGDYTGGVSVMDRHYARAREAVLLADAMFDWLDELPQETSAYTPCTVPQTGSSAGLTEAPRGALGHWLSVENQKIKRYQVITPTCWTVSPRDTMNQRGPLEEALVGTPIHNAAMPVEALRVIHSVDPCLDCATHVVEPGTLTGAKVNP
jgi:hydrogenase large subunit